MIQEVNSITPNVLHISSGKKEKVLLTLCPKKNINVSVTHPAPKTHIMWAKTINLLLDRA
jgi:hypothetical protein